MAAYPKQMPLNSVGEDRRQGKRMPLRCSAQFFRQNRMVLATTTDNLSKGGFYCRVNERLTPGEEFDCFLRLPGAFTSSSSGTALVLACRCRVARVEALSHDSYGLGCQIENYLIMPE